MTLANPLPVVPMQLHCCTITSAPHFKRSPRTSLTAGALALAAGRGVLVRGWADVGIGADADADADAGVGASTRRLLESGWLAEPLPVAAPPPPARSG